MDLINLLLDKPQIVISTNADTILIKIEQTGPEI